MSESHPLAELLPAMPEAEYAELLASIRENGQREPITLHRDGRTIDGRHRRRACAEAGIEPVTRTFDGPDSAILAYVLDLNLKRRHLNESQRAMIAAALATMPEGRPANNRANLHGKATAAAMLKVSARSVASAKQVIAKAIPAIIEAVRSGQMPVSQADQVSRLPKARQQEVAGNMGNGKSLLTTVLTATRAERVAVIDRASTSLPLAEAFLGRRFPVLYADPPWDFKQWSAGGQKKAAAMHYPTMPTAEICALPVADIAAADSVLFMWAVPTLLPDALAVIEAWGFTYISHAVWVKPNIATGFWFRGQHEDLLVAKRGNMPPPSPSLLHSSVFTGDTATGAHSEKPDVVRDWIRSAYPETGRIELFARTEAAGWERWGNQAPAEAVGVC